MLTAFWILTKDIYSNGFSSEQSWRSIYIHPVSKCQWDLCRRKKNFGGQFMLSPMKHTSCQEDTNCWEQSMVQCKRVNIGPADRELPGGCLVIQQRCVPLRFVRVRILPLSTSRDNWSFKRRILNNKKCTQVEVKEEHKREMIHCHNWSRRITHSYARSFVVLCHCANESPFVYTLGVVPYQYREETETVCSRDYTSNFSENF